MNVKEGLSGWSKKKSEQVKEKEMKRSFLSIHWKCCNAFSRIYKSKDGKTYQGNCPKCRSFLSVPIGPGGTKRRLFHAQ